MKVMSTAVWTSCWKPVGEGICKMGTLLPSNSSSPPGLSSKAWLLACWEPGPGRPPSRLPALSCQSPFLKVLRHPVETTVPCCLPRASSLISWELQAQGGETRSLLISTSPQSTKLSSQQL